MASLSSLRRFLADPPDQAPVQEVCELCATPVPDQHPHLVQVAERRMICACGPCGFLALEAWTSGVGGGRLAAQLQPDVEALLVRRDKAGSGGAHGRAAECLLVPIDACYRLVGLVRLHWRGFDGGADAWREIDNFFDALREQAVPVRAAT